MYFLVPFSNTKKAENALLCVQKRYQKIHLEEKFIKYTQPHFQN